jgi:hypothetical protein
VVVEVVSLITLLTVENLVVAVEDLVEDLVETLPVDQEIRLQLVHLKDKMVDQVLDQMEMDLVAVVVEH